MLARIIFSQSSYRLGFDHPISMFGLIIRLQVPLLIAYGSGNSKMTSHKTVLSLHNPQHKFIKTGYWINEKTKFIFRSFFRVSIIRKTSWKLRTVLSQTVKVKIQLAREGIFFFFYPGHNAPFSKVSFHSIESIRNDKFHSQSHAFFFSAQD